MVWTPQILHDKIVESASIQTQQPKAWDWIDEFKQEKNAILLVFEVLKACANLDTFRLTVMVLKKIIDNLISILQTPDIAAFIDLLMGITTNNVISDKPTLNNVCYILARLSTRSEDNMIIQLFTNFKKSIEICALKRPDFCNYFIIYLFSFMYESLITFDEKRNDAQHLHNQFRSIANDLMSMMQEHRNVCFNVATECLRIGIKLDIFNLQHNNLYNNLLFVQLFQVLLDPNSMKEADITSIPGKIESIINKLKRKSNIRNYEFYDKFFINFLNILQNSNETAYINYEDDDEFVFNLYYMTYAIVTIHEEDISSLLLQESNTFQPIPIIEMTIFCLQKTSVSKLVSCVTIWRDMLYLCREKMIQNKIYEWGKLQMNVNISHYYIHYMKNIISVINRLSCNTDNFCKGFVRFHQSYLAFFDKPPLYDQIIKDHIVENYIKPNAITLSATTCDTQLTILSAKGFLGVVFLKMKLRCEFMPLVKLFIDNNLYHIENVYSNDPFMHWSMVDLIAQIIELRIQSTSSSNGVPLSNNNNISSNDTEHIPVNNYLLSTSNIMAYLLYLLDGCPKFDLVLYNKIIRCLNRLFTLDFNSFQVYLPDLSTFVNNSYNIANNNRMETALDMIDLCVDFTCSYLSKTCDITPILSSLFSPHVDLICVTLERHKVNKNALSLFKTALEALDYSICKDFYTHLIDKVLPLFLSIVMYTNQEHEIIECACSCVRRIIRDLGPAFNPYLAQLIPSIEQAYKKNFHPTFLYISSVVVDEFARYAENDCTIASQVTNLVVTMFDLTLPQMSNLDDTNHNDRQLQDHIDQSIEDFFVLIKRLLRLYSDPFFNYPKIEIICELATKFLSRKDSYTVLSVVTFWIIVFDIARKSTNTIHKETATKILFHYSPRIVYTVMCGMIGQPIYCILEPYCDLLFELRCSNENLYLQCLNLTLTQVRNNDHIPAHIAIVEEIGQHSLSVSNPDTLVDMCERVFIKHR